MVDWSLARQVARLAAGTASAPRGAVGELADLTERMREEVGAYTGLVPRHGIPAAEAVDRAEWAAVNIESLAELLDPVVERLDRRLGFAGPLSGALRAGAGATLAAEAGLVLGYASQRVLGQYELSLLAPEPEARLLYVTPNLARAVDELGVDRDSFLGWIAIHELTHAFQFTGVPWLHDHLRGLLRRYLESVEVRIESGAAGGLPSLPNPVRLVEAFREGGLAALVQTREQRDLTAKVQAVMSVVEGYAEHVMDALGPRLLPEFGGLRDAMERRRASRSAPERIIERLLGFDLKLRQYAAGRAFCADVVGEAGLDGLNRVWESPAALPSAAEIQHPGRWLERISAGAPAAT